VYESIIRVGAAIAKNLKPDALAAAQSLSKLASETKKLETAKKSAAAYQKLDAAVGKAKAKYDQARESLRRLEEAEKAAGGATKESTAWRKAGERAVAAAAREMDRATKAAEKNAKALRELGINTANLAKEQQRLAAASRFAEARAKLFGDKKSTPVPLVQKAGEQFRSLTRDVMVLGTAVAGTGAGLFALVTRVGNAGDATAKMAKRVGIGVEALQELRYAGEREGATAEDVDSAIGKLAINIGKFKNAKAKGGGGAMSIPGLQMLGEGGGASGGGETDPFKRIGLNAAKLAQLKPDKQIEQIADAMGKLKTDADRAAVAQAIFGREGGLKLIPLLKGGAAGMAQLRKEARELGFVLDENAAKQAEEFNDRMLDAKLAATGMANTLGVALLPVVTKTFTQFTAWVKENRAEIKAWVENAAKWIETRGIPALIEIGKAAKSFAEKMATLVGGAAKLVGGFDNLAIAIGALRLAPLAVTLGKIGIEGFKAAAAMFKYAAATRAAKAAEGTGSGGGGGGALGMLGLVGAGLATAGAVDSAVLGTKASTWQKLLGKVGLDSGGDFGDMTVADFKDPEKLKEFAKRNLQAQMARGKTEINIDAPVTVQPGSTREDIASGFDAAKLKALEDYDRRVSFGQ
jgi:hypothetical protein